MPKPFYVILKNDSDAVPLTLLATLTTQELINILTEHDIDKILALGIITSNLK